MTFQYADLSRAADLQQWIAHYERSIETARRLPLLHAGHEDEAGNPVFAHEALLMHPEKLHAILIEGVIADAEKQIADLRRELERMGVTMPDVAEASPRFVMIQDATKSEPEPLPVKTVMALKSPKPKRGKR